MGNDERSRGIEREGTNQGRDRDLETGGGDHRNGIGCIIFNNYTL